MIYSTEAIILQTYKYGDTSLICSLFSKNYGKISIIAKGVRTIKNPHRAILQPLHNINISYYFKRTRNMQILKEASIENHYYNLKKKYLKLAYSYASIDILNYISQIDNPCDIIFRLIKSVLDKIESCDTSESKIYFLFYQIQLLKYLGYQLNIIDCSRCNIKIIDGAYSLQMGDMVCNNCIQNNNLILGEKTLRAINKLQNTHIKKLANFNIVYHNEIDIIEELLINYLSFHVFDMRKLKSLRFITKNEYKKI